MGDRILIFGRQSIDTWAGHVRKLHVDGTFSVAPPLFSQIVVILAEREGFVLPICYALLANKEPEFYSSML